MIRRQCTKEYKVEVVHKEIRRLLGLYPGERAKTGMMVEQWIGISVNEAGRMRDSQKKYITNRYPLIFDLDPPMSRQDCLRWIEENGFPRPPRSACLGCPFRSDTEWRLVQENADEWADVIEFDRSIRAKGGLRGQIYLHKSGKPLNEVDFSTAEEQGQMNWINECMGMCGV